MSIEAMKQALEALDAPSSPMLRIIQEEAITSLRQAIEQAEKQDGVCQHCAGKGCVACDVREQEPVAWMWKDGTLTIDPDRADGTWTPLYTTPQPQREWVGLTDAEIEEFDYDFRDLVMDIEKLLMERNS